MPTQSNHLTGKTGLLFVASLTLLLAACTVYEESSPPPAATVVYATEPTVDEDSAYVEIRNENDFYTPLNSYGHWQDVGTEGRCWIPGQVDRDWRPYSNGHWRRTDAGWYWASDEPWGWATYHYGRWDRSEQFGWYWVPETQWAPAWVSWHEGGGYVGWAPLRPSSRSGGNVTIDVNIKVASPEAYVFVQERQFLQPVRPTNVIVNNTTIINQTTNITNVKIVNKTVINEGPRPEGIERATGQKVEVVPVRTARREQEISVAAPHQTPKNNAAVKNVRPARKSPPHPKNPTAPAPVPAASVAPAVSTKEPGAAPQPKEATSAGANGENPVHPDKKTAVEPNRENAAPVTIQKKPAEEIKPRPPKPKKTTPQEQKHAKELADQAKRDAEKRAKEKEQEAADQHGKSEPAR